MAVVSLPTFYMPMRPAGITAAPSFTTTALTIDAADEGAGFLVQAPKTGNIRKVGWATRTVTTGATLDVRLETVDQSATPAVPTGTLWGTTTNGSQVVANADDNVWFLTSLTADAAVTMGDVLAVVIKNPTASFGNLQISGFADDSDTEFPYCLLNTGVSPAASWAAATAAPVLAFEYDDGTYEYVHGCWPIKGTITAHTFSTASTPDAVGLRFKTSIPLRICGFWVYVDSDADFSVKLVSEAYHQANATGILASKSLDKDLTKGTNAAPQTHSFTAKYTTTADTWYRLIVEPTSGSNLSIYDFDVNTLALLDAFAGQNWHLTTAKDPTADGSWTNYNSGTFRVPFLGLAVDGADAGGSSGGGGVIY
jgi:hypothetical protein